jgi:hypothetical protein
MLGFRKNELGIKKFKQSDCTNMIETYKVVIDAAIRSLWSLVQFPMKQASQNDHTVQIQ